MNSIEAKQKMFEIIEKYQNNTITEDDVKILTEILIKNNPYTNYSNDITISFEKLSEEEKSTNAYYLNTNKNITINTEYIAKVNKKSYNTIQKSPSVSLIEFMNTIFHELRHYNQHNNTNQLNIELGKEQTEIIVNSLKEGYKEERDYSENFVKDYVKLFKEGFSGEFSENLSDEENIEDIVNEIRNSFYYREAYEFDARQSAIKISRGFIRDIFNDPNTPDSIKDWCKEDALFLKKIEENEEFQNDISFKYNNFFHNLQIQPKQIKQFANNINSIMGKLETAVSKTKTEEAITARNNFRNTCVNCVKHLFKDKNLDDLVNYYVVALVNPSFYAINIEDESVSLAGLNNDILINTLQSKIGEKLKNCSAEQKFNVSKKILKISKLPIVMASLNSSHINLNLLTTEDKKSLFVQSICSYSATNLHRTSNINEVLNSFNPTNNQDVNLIDMILNFYKQNFNADFKPEDKIEQKAVKLEKSRLLKRFAKNLNINSLMSKFGKAEEFENILNKKQNLSAEEKLNLSLEIDNIDTYKINLAIHGKIYAKYMQIKDQTINLKNYNTEKNFIENSESENSIL